MHKRPFFKAFWWSYAAISLTGFLLIILYLTDSAVDLVFLFKIPLTLAVLVVVVFHLYFRLKVTGVAILFGCASVLAVVIGSIKGNLFTGPSLTHVYMTLVPILATSFGYHFAAYQTSVTELLMRRVIAFLFAISLVTLLCYYYFFYVSKSIAYFGFDSYLPLVSAMFLADRRYFAYAASVVLVFFSGKRAPLIAMMSPILLMFGRAALVPRFANLAFAVVALAGLAGGLHLAQQSGLLYRFEPLMKLDVTDYENLYLATSGRSAEVIGLLNHMRAEPSRWFIGSGYGGHYLVEGEFRGEFFHLEHHYLHLAVFTYLLVFGAPFVLLLLGYIAFMFWRNRSHLASFYYLAMLVTFIGSIFGAGLIVEPVFWFFLGTNVYLAHRKSEVLE